MSVHILLGTWNPVCFHNWECTRIGRITVVLLLSLALVALHEKPPKVPQRRVTNERWFRTHDWRESPQTTKLCLNN